MTLINHNKQCCGNTKIENILGGHNEHTFNNQHGRIPAKLQGS